MIPGMNQTIVITRLDEKHFTSLAGALFLPNGNFSRDQGIDEVYVKPGRHELFLHWRHGDIYATSRLWFIAETGKSYAVRWKKNDDGSFWGTDLGTTSIWIEEVETGKHVGGILE
jgi:hypothetical protein